MKHHKMKDHAEHGMHHMKHGHSHGHYENEVERPPEPMEGHMLHGMGCHEFKGEADPIAYGQAGGPLAMADSKKIHSQFKDYHWD